MRKWLMDNSDDVVETLVAETGKTYEDANLIELLYTGGALTYWAKHAKRFLADERVGVRTLAVTGKKLVTRYEPLGLVGIIGPWNYPLVNSFGDAIPALLAGNSVILKPSEFTPLTSLLLADGLARVRACPADVFQVATGRGATGAALVDEADMIMFTGSTATGKKVMARAAQTLTPVVARARRQGPDDRARPTPTSSAPPTPPSTTRCSTAARRASRSSASTSRTPVYDDFVGARRREGRRRCARASRPGPARPRSAR